MSLTQRVKQGFLRLPSSKKAILLASAGLTVSTVMPWYDLRNGFGVGETYLGLQGPLFVIGALILICGVVSFSNMFFPLMGRHFWSLRKRGGTLALALGAQSLLLLLVGNVIFYHPDFTSTVSSKGTRFGMLVTFTSIAIMLVAGYLVRRKEGEGEEDTEDIMTKPTPVFQAPSLLNDVPVTQSPQGQDPLTLNPKARYKMMRSQARYSSNAQNNLWGGGPGSAFSRLNRVEAGSENDSDY